MFYVFDILIPAKTLETSKDKTILPLHPGIIYQVEVSFRSGPIDLAHLQVRRGLFQIWPRNPNSDFKGNLITTSFSEEWYLAEEPYRLEAYTWNTDDTFPHTVTIRIGVYERPGRFV